jgi:hypothetical protein
MPPPAAPFEVALISLLQISQSSGLHFSAPVTVASEGIEGNIDAPAGNSPTVTPISHVLVVPVSSWLAGLPNLGQAWTFDGTPFYIAADPPATGFVAGSGLVVA